MLSYGLNGVIVFKVVFWLSVYWLKIYECKGLIGYDMQSC